MEYQVRPDTKIMVIAINPSGTMSEDILTFENTQKYPQFIKVHLELLGKPRGWRD